MHLSTAWHHIRRSPYQALAAVLTMSLTLFVATVFAASAYGTQLILKELEKQPQITVFFSDIKSEEDIRALDERLKQTGKVEHTVYVSKEDALRIYQEQNKDDPLLLEMVTADILPASLEISAIDPSHLEDLDAIVKEEPGVEDVVFQKDIVDTLISWTTAARITGIILVSILGTVSLLVLLTVIAFKIAMRQKEIEILELLGASDWYIRLPFLYEGSIYGIVAAILAWGATYLVLLYLQPVLASLLVGFTGVIIITPMIMVLLLGTMMGVGFILGLFGSFLALIRYG